MEKKNQSMKVTVVQEVVNAVLSQVGLNCVKENTNIVTINTSI